ncbi:SMI1/KNR4 family protein [Thermoactinomyces intermedius]|jgi:antitoxin YxxD|uniref:SMI1/KNR4 family protein n=1 Tax=Thermoactinomyces intermedius TaxID=2024 RepID=A0A8I1DEF2_THEIN|nr:SMI1/KNR4 family protein [Thermoactinomyces intermedius]MBA4548722.1 SMI1/KNR4 family protein [Thermoactinomyces intermedius]MBA4836796.1 SMI1/KNR4 family protein [Thermoactinomyces intermedius]MBH8594600.1 SMI1/KNR4 family protein [Thermoactinomyces intermedius]
MCDFSFLKKYVLPSEHIQAPLDFKHEFYPVGKREMEAAEKRLNRKFPKELREFYLQIGYGFMWTVKDRMSINRIMDPDSVADLLLGENVYEDYYLADEFAEEPQLFPFFEVGDDIMISLDLSLETDNGNHPVDYTGLKVANSLEEFLRKLDAEQDYYVRFTYEEDED